MVLAKKPPPVGSRVIGLLYFCCNKSHPNAEVKYVALLAGCQVLLWNKPIKSHRNQSVRLYTQTGLEYSRDFGPEKMFQYVAYLD